MLKIGDPAPIFNLHDQDGNLTTLDQFKGKWLVLYFYPKDDTEGCTKEACSFSDAVEHMEALNAVVVGVSPDSPESHQAFQQKHNIKLLLLCDEKLEVIKAYEAWGIKEDRESVLRTTYLIDPNSNIQAIFRDVQVDNHLAEVTRELEKQASH